MLTEFQRNNIAALTDEALGKECVSAIRLANRIPDGFNRLWRDGCYGEANRRGKLYLYLAALEEVRLENAASRVLNAKPPS